MAVERHTINIVREGAQSAEIAERMNDILAAAATKALAEQPTDTREVGQKPMTWQRPAIGWGIIAFGALLFAQLLALWPAVIAATTAGGTTPETTVLFGLAHITFNPEVALLLMVASVGALASLVELMRAFSKYAGRDELSRRWTWWYLLRPVQGAALAVVVYFALRGGLLEGINGAQQQLNPFGVAAFAAFVGLFTRHAVEKLRKVFDVLFYPPKEDQNIVVTKTPISNGAAESAPSRSSPSGG